MPNKIPPPVIFLLCLVLMYALPSCGTLPSLSGLAIGIGLVGTVIALLSVKQFIHAKTTILPHHFSGTTQLVTTGVFRLSRNPMYLSLVLWLVAFALWLGNPLAWAVLPLFIGALNRFQIQPEEHFLHAKFGDTYAQYCQRVRRWI